MKKARLFLTLLLGLSLAACSSSGSGTTSTTNSDGEVLSSVAKGVALPQDISAVPADTSTTGAKVTKGFLAMIRSLKAASDLADTTDYAKANPNIFIEERALEQFDIIEQIFKTLAQTHYSDPENVNNGPYKAMVAWEEDQGGKDIKQLQTWTVESRMIVETVPSDVTGNTTGDVNRLMAWIPETDHKDGSLELVKAEFKIFTPPTKASDGSLLDFGEWDMNVLFDASTTAVDTIPAGGPEDYFAASARIAANGTSTLMIHDRFSEDFGPGSPEMAAELKGILVRNGADGYGQVSYPDWEACFGGMGGEGDGSMGGGPMSNPCETGIPQQESEYVYNANYLAVRELDEGVAGAVTYKDRNLDGAIRIVHRYSLFHKLADSTATPAIAAGDDLERHKNFGFPVTYQRAAENNSELSFEEFAFYGAWQGRHQLWGSGGYTAEGGSGAATVFTRQDVRAGETPATYTLKEFNGTFTMRTLVTASLNDILNIPVETWLNDHYDLFYMSSGPSGADWYSCAGWVDWWLLDTGPGGGNDPANACRNNDETGTVGTFTALTGSDLLSQLSVGNGERRWVNIGGEDAGQFKQYVYLTADPSVTGFTFTTAGFYEADWGNNGQMVPTAGATVLIPSDGKGLYVDIGGSIFVAYNGDFSGAGTGWVQKTLQSFDTQNWTPTFAAGGDSVFTPQRGQDYYMNAKGQNYVVKRVGDATTSAATYSAKLELQTSANPANSNLSASLLPAGTAYLAMPWNADVKYTLEEDPANANYLLLKVAHDSSGNATAGTVSTEDYWGLVAYKDVNGDTDLATGSGYSDDVPLAFDGTALVVDEWGWVDPSLNNNNEPMQFNWEYSGGDGNSWGKQQFLRDLATNEFVLLSDPVMLTGVQLYDNLGAAVSGEIVPLQFDGWMHGLPDMYFELQKSNWDITGLGDKVRRLTEGQEVTDSNGVVYYVKPMEMSLFLGTVTAFPAGPQPDIAAAEQANLDNVPSFVAHGMGATPVVNTVKYSEGTLVE